MIRFQFWHNATGVIEINGQRILLDPWLVEDEPPFFGAWYHWPRLPADIIEQVGDCDVIWISHCHEDHYHLPSLRAYMRRWGQKPICTASMLDPVLADGFMLSSIHGGLTIVAANGIDSALAVRNEAGESIVNLTDVHYEQEMIDEILDWCGGPPTIALIPFAGAGPWPQTYYSDPAVLAAKAAEKQAMFVARYLQFRDALGAKVNIPFAGQYRLGGRLAHLNKWRGMNDAVDVPGERIVLGVGGSASIQDGQLLTDGMRETRLPDPPEAAMAYEADPMPTRSELPALLAKAWARTPADGLHFSVDWGDAFWYAGSSHSARSMMLAIDPRLLYRLLTGTAHWADADAGSHYTVTRHPDVYDKAIMDWLWSFRA